MLSSSCHLEVRAARREDYQQLQANLGADIETFQQHTEVRWLSIGPTIHRVLEQWDTICHFIKDLEKDNTRKPKSINFKRAAALLATGERNVTRVMLEFLRSTAPVFKEFLTVLQTSGPTVHVVYDAMRLTLLKLMRRFVQADQLKDYMARHCDLSHVKVSRINFLTVNLL